MENKENKMLSREEVDELLFLATGKKQGRAATEEEVKAIYAEFDILEKELGHPPELQAVLEKLNLTDIEIVTEEEHLRQNENIRILTDEEWEMIETVAEQAVKNPNCPKYREEFHNVLEKLNLLKISSFMRREVTEMGKVAHQFSPTDFVICRCEKCKKSQAKK